MTKETSKQIADNVWASLGDCALRTAATHEPSQLRVSALRVSVDYRAGRATIRPTFICRTRKEPHMRGHRQWLKLEGR
jgi:hypothetical protein